MINEKDNCHVCNYNEKRSTFITRFCSEACFVAFRLKSSFFFSKIAEHHHIHFHYPGNFICYYFSIIPTVASNYFSCHNASPDYIIWVDNNRFYAWV